MAKFQSIPAADPADGVVNASGRIVLGIRVAVLAACADTRARQAHYLLEWPHQFGSVSDRHSVPTERHRDAPGSDAQMGSVAEQVIDDEEANE
jgi:hypothetical protein